MPRIKNRYPESVIAKVSTQAKEELDKLALEDDRSVSYVLRKLIEKHLIEKENL